MKDKIINKPLTLDNMQEYAELAAWCRLNNYHIACNGNQYYYCEMNVEDKSVVASQEIDQIKNWFLWYDEQVAQYNRSIRLGEEFDKDINELDAQAETKAARIRELKALLESE